MLRARSLVVWCDIRQHVVGDGEVLLSQMGNHGPIQPNVDKFRLLYSRGICTVFSWHLLESLLCFELDLPVYSELLLQDAS